MTVDRVRLVVEEDGYCCVYGYLKTCFWRGQTVESIAEYAGVDPHAIYKRVKKIAEGRATHACLGQSDCMKGLFTPKSQPPES